MRKWNFIITILLFILGAICFIFFDVRPINLLEDPIANKLLCGFISRFGLSLLFGWMLYQFGGHSLMKIDSTIFKSLLWALPCFMVAFINFPYSALLTNTAYVARGDLMGFYVLYVVGIAILEELIFRGTLVVLINDVLRGQKHKPFFTVLICSLIFSLFHLTNLFEGADIGSVLLQCLYTFLIGAMLTVTVLRTRNIWLCILIHAIFDFGGLLIIQIGGGNPWDTLFWILTIAGGVLCAGHIIFTLIKLEKDYVS